MPSNALFREILKQLGVEYGLFDSHRRLYEFSPNLLRLIKDEPGPVRGRSLESLFDELIGLEGDLDTIGKGEHPPLKIEKIHRSPESESGGYLTLAITPYLDGLLLLVSDVTTEADLEQRVTQQRNELDLLAGQLAAARAQLDDLLHRFLPEAVADFMVANPTAVQLGGERKEVTILFADLRGFTRWTEGVAPETALQMLNEKLAIAVNTLIEKGGTLDKYMGDAVMGVFNAPNPDLEHALHAVQAAWTLIRALKADPILQFSVGINTGTAVAGNIGTNQAMNYTVIGDAVNQAKRLQEMAKPGQVLISGDTYNLVRPYIDVLPLGSFQLRGRQQETEVFAIMDVADA